MNIEFHKRCDGNVRSDTGKWFRLEKIPEFQPDGFTSREDVLVEERHPEINACCTEPYIKCDERERSECREHAHRPKELFLLPPFLRNDIKEQQTEEQSALMAAIGGGIGYKKGQNKDIPEGTITTQTYYNDLLIAVTLK